MAFWPETSLATTFATPSAAKALLELAYPFGQFDVGRPVLNSWLVFGSLASSLRNAPHTAGAVAMQNSLST